MNNNTNLLPLSVGIEELVKVFQDAWHKADLLGDESNRTRAGIKAVILALGYRYDSKLPYDPKLSYDSALVNKIASNIQGTMYQPLNPRARAILDLIAEHEAKTGRAWFWVPAPDVIPAGQPYRKERGAGIVSEAISSARWTLNRPSPDATYFVDCRWTPPEPERVSVDKAALDELRMNPIVDRDALLRVRALLDSVQPLDGGQS